MEEHPHNCAFWSTLLVECLPIFCFPNHRRIDNGSLWYSHVIPYSNFQWQIKEISSTLRSNIPFRPPFSMEQNKPCVLMWTRKCVSYFEKKMCINNPTQSGQWLFFLQRGKCTWQMAPGGSSKNPWPSLSIPPPPQKKKSIWSGVRFALSFSMIDLTRTRHCRPGAYSRLRSGCPNLICCQGAAARIRSGLSCLPPFLPLLLLLLLVVGGEGWDMREGWGGCRRI